MKELGTCLVGNKMLGPHKVEVVQALDLPKGFKQEIKHLEAACLVILRMLRFI